jgi:hypothetical protein
MQSLPETTEINEYIKEYLRHSGMMNTLECFEAEIKTKQVRNLADLALLSQGLLKGAELTNYINRTVEMMQNQTVSA